MQPHVATATLFLNSGNVTDAILHALGFSSLDQEVDDVALPVDGVLPDWLTGMLI